MQLVSHSLCPYVQRCAITLVEKGLTFERINIDLARKPDWFLALSPMGKTPVLRVAGESMFESAVICEYLDEIKAPQWLPTNSLLRARQRAWVAFASALLDDIARYYSASDEAALQQHAAALRRSFEQIEARLGDGPWFSGSSFGLVDAAMAPALRYFECFDRVADFGFWSDLPRLQAWRQCLAERPSVQAAVAPDYLNQLAAFVQGRGGALAQRLAAAASPAMKASSNTE